MNSRTPLDRRISGHPSYQPPLVSAAHIRSKNPIKPSLSDAITTSYLRGSSCHPSSAHPRLLIPLRRESTRSCSSHGALTAVRGRWSESTTSGGTSRAPSSFVRAAQIDSTLIFRDDHRTCTPCGSRNLPTHWFCRDVVFGWFFKHKLITESFLRSSNRPGRPAVPSALGRAGDRYAPWSERAAHRRWIKDSLGL